MKWLLGNWELKLVSLVVAVALWTYTSGQVRVERVVQVEFVPAQVAGLPADLQVAAVEPSEFSVVLSVPTSKLGEVREQTLRPALALPRDRRSPGDVELALTSRLLGLDPDIRVVRTEPGEVRAVTIRLSAIAQGVLAAEAPPVIGLPPGIAAEVRLDRTRVEVRGSREAVMQAETDGSVLRFVPVRLDGVDPFLAAPREERVALHPQEGPLVPVEPVIATIALHPARSASVVLRVPVPVLLDADKAGRYRIDGPPPQAEVRLTGPEAVVRAVRAEDVIAWADLRAVATVAGVHDAVVQVQPIAGVQAEAPRLRLVLVAIP